ncbi:MAG: OmpA family protein [Flavobacteriales bacterium]
MNRKLLLTLLFILLVGWIAGCTYWYVCNIRKNCDTELVEETEDNIDNYESIDENEAVTAVEKPLFSIADGETVIAESDDNISFASGLADMIIPETMSSEMNLLGDYLKNNPNKNLTVTGLFSTENESDSLGMVRANSIISYFESTQNIAPERMTAVSQGTEGFYINEESQRIVGGVAFEITSQEEIAEVAQKELAEPDIVVASKNIDKRLQRRVKSRKTMYYPLTHFDIEPTYELEDYFKNLKKYFENNPEGLIQITGHTADDGGSYFNMLNSKKYAEKVKKYLVREYEINPRNFRSAGRGATRPAASSDTDLGRAENRRIVFSFIK